MSETAIEKIYRVFGLLGFPEALFYNAEHALRFELGAGFDYNPLRFMQAMDRARAITNLAFFDSQTLTAIVCHYARQGCAPTNSEIGAALSGVGFKEPFTEPESTPQNDELHIEDYGEDIYRHWYSADFINDSGQLTALLWAALARELPIAPKALDAHYIYIVDFAGGTAVLPYDDRGLDLIGTISAPLKPLYRHFNEWLLDSDRPAMDSKFS